MAKKYDAGVKEYRETYWMPDYTPKDTDILACFKITPQPGVPREEAAAAVAAESSTGTWTTVWTDLLTDLDHYKGRAYAIEDVPGDDTCYYANCDDGDSPPWGYSDSTEGCPGGSSMGSPLKIESRKGSGRNMKASRSTDSSRRSWTQD